MPVPGLDNVQAAKLEAVGMYRAICAGLFALAIFGAEFNIEGFCSKENRPVVLKAKVEYNDWLQPGIVGMDILVTRSGYPVIRQVLVDLPGSGTESGLMAGDRVLAINGTPVFGRRSGEIDLLISDVPGDKVRFRVQRGEKTLDYDVTVLSLDDVDESTRNQYRLALKRF